MQAWENIAKIGTVVETDAQSKALARVNICGRISDWLPVLHFVNSFKRSISPVRVDEQVMVICPHGEANGGFIIRGVFNTSCKEPTGASPTCEVTEYEDGTRFSYDSAAKELKIEASNKITIVCKSASVTCDDATVKADSVSVDSPSIDLGLDGAGVVTGECKCAFTGLPHPDMSANTRSKF